MVDSITLNVVCGKNSEIKQCSLLTENKNYINSIIELGENNSITEAQMEQLRHVAARSGDSKVLEQSDLNGQNKINLAKLNGFDEYYDISLSKDGKLMQVKIKDAGMLVKNPILGTIKKDFGVRDHVFIQGDEVPYGNEDIIYNNEIDYVSDYNNKDYDRVILKVGQTINIPVNEVNINGTPKGFLGRFFQ